MTPPRWAERLRGRVPRVPHGASPWVGGSHMSPPSPFLPPCLHARHGVTADMLPLCPPSTATCHPVVPSGRDQATCSYFKFLHNRDISNFQFTAVPCWGHPSGVSAGPSSSHCPPGSPFRLPNPAAQGLHPGPLGSMLPQAQSLRSVAPG